MKNLSSGKLLKQNQYINIDNVVDFSITLYPILLNKSIFEHKINRRGVIMNEIKNVALYIRVSTDRQAKEGDSLEAQESALREYALKHNYIIVDTYIDGGESGQKMNRTNLQRLLEDVKQKKIDMILITKLDRWFRNIKDFYKVQEILVKHKVVWKTIWEEYDTSTAGGELWLNISLSLGQMEAKRTAERINNVFDYKYNVQKTVCTGCVPYGYKISGDKKLIVDEEQAKIINELYDKYIETNNLNKTIIWFQQNHEPKSHYAIRKYLTNSAYIGKFIRTKTKEMIENYSPKIVDEYKFNKVQKMLKANIKRKTSQGNLSSYIFNGLVKCSHCGFNMTGSYKNLASGQVHHYRCKRSQIGCLCDYKYPFPEKRIEQYLIENIIQKIDIKISEIEAEKKQKTNTKDMTVEYKKKMNKLTDLYINELIDIDHYKKEYNKYKLLLEEKKEKPIENTIDYKKIKQLLEKDILDIYNILSNEEKRKIWLSIIKEINLDGKEDIDFILI